MREVISVHVGQAGLQLGEACWELCISEHNLDQRGNIATKKDSKCDGFESFFIEMQSGNYSPRAVLVDLEPSVVDGIRMGAHKELYNPATILNGKEDAANNYARGYYTTGVELIGCVMESIRRQAESCEKLQGFMAFHSFGGGTGSGLNSLLGTYLTEEFPKQCKLEIAIFPSPTMSTSVVEPYNAVLSTNTTMDNTDCVILVDNEAMYSICQKRLDIDSPNYKNLNRLLAQTVSSITSSLRFQGTLNADFIDFRTNLVPYPRIHFPIVGFAPIIASHCADHETLSIVDITNRSIDPMNRLVKCNNEMGCYMACCLLYRGDVVPKDVNAAIHQLKSKREVQFVGWSPTGFKVGINDSPPGHIEGGDLACLRRAVCMICNTTAIKEAWIRLNVKYNVMLEKRAFCHWYTGEGMEEQEFTEAQDNLLTLEQDYEMLTAE